MKKIEEIDKNFKPAELDGMEMNFFDTGNVPFSIEGFAWRKPGDQSFFRLPKKMTKKQVNEGALSLAHHTAGGAVRFRSDSTVIALRATLVDSFDMSHMPRAGSAGFDLYESAEKGKGLVHAGTVQPCRDQENICVIVARNEKGTMRDWILNMPLYGGVKKLEIGVVPGAKIDSPKPHKIARPVLFYGSSITQGGCASRPGNAYTSMLCREVDAEQINLGFSGSGRGEKAVAEAIAGLDLAAFVMDYDHNAPSPEALESTHEPFFRIIREKNPLLPVIFLSRPDVWEEMDTAALEGAMKRRNVVRTTFRNAVEAGDQNVFFVDGLNLFGKKFRSACTVDRTHPNDLGFYRMFKAVLPTLKKALKRTKN